MAKKKSTHQNQNNNQDTQVEEMDPNPNPNPNPKPENPTGNGNENEREKEKLSSLKSLNAMLLKETVEKRQEVSALSESKKALEFELTRSELEVESLRVELTRMEGLVRDKEGVERRLEEVESELGVVVKERDEIEKSKVECDLQIGSLKKLENELRNEVLMAREAYNRATCENEVLKGKFEAQVEEGTRMRYRLVEVEARERNVVEELEDLKFKYRVAVKAVEDGENRFEAMGVELRSLERNCDEMKGEIEGLKGKKEVILREKLELEKERGELEGRISELEKEACGLNDVVVSLREDEEKWRVKLFELEKMNEEMVGRVDGLGRELNASLKEKSEMEKEIEGLLGEKWSAMRRLSELESDLEGVKLVKENVLEEKYQLDLVKSRQEDEIVELQNKVKELMSNVALLQQSNSDHLEKNRRLLSDIDDHKSVLERVTSERDEAKRTLEEERVNGMRLQDKVSEMSKRMEEIAKGIEELRSASDTLVGEKKVLENKYNKMVEEKGLSDKKYADAHKKITDLEVTLRSKTDTFESVLAMLKNTTMQLSKPIENGKEEANDGIMNGEIEPYLAELEAIRSVFRNREAKVGEMQQEMESLQLSVLEARKNKSFLTAISSVTTILAAVASFAYATKVRS